MVRSYKIILKRISVRLLRFLATLFYYILWIPGKVQKRIPKRKASEKCVANHFLALGKQIPVVMHVQNIEGKMWDIDVAELDRHFREIRGPGKLNLANITFLEIDMVQKFC